MLANNLVIFVVDEKCWRMNVKRNEANESTNIKKRKQNEMINSAFNVEVDYELKIGKFIDVLCVYLESGKRKIC